MAPTRACTATTTAATTTLGARPVLEVNVADVTPVDSYGTEPATKLYSQGQLVKYNGDTFHALYDVYSCDGTMDIMSIYNLNSTGTAQVNDTYSNYKCAFSSSQYWSSTNQNINNIPGGDTDVTYCVPRIKKYALNKGALNGRLLTYEEALDIKNGTNTTAKDMLYGSQNTAQTYEGKGYLNYWLGSSGSDARYVWLVYGDAPDLSSNFFSASNGGRGSPSFNSLNV